MERGTWNMIHPAPFIDHTLLKPDATSDRIRRLCEEAVEYGFASVCVPPAFISLAADLLYGSSVQAGTVVGFPCGYVGTEVKVFETAEALARGAQEIDMVINLGAPLEGRPEAVEKEIRAVVGAAGSVPVKVILECCYLDDDLKKELTERVVAGGGAYVKTSTGFGPGGATVDDVRLLAAAAGGRIGVKAAGGVRTWSFCRELLAAGATRIGTSAGVALMEEWRAAEGR